MNSLTWHRKLEMYINTMRLLPRFRLRTLLVLVALATLGVWASLMELSPTWRLARLVRADQPTYVRREAAAALGHGIPSWEVGRAVALLIEVCEDPSPRVRENAIQGLSQLGPRAEPAVPRLLALLGDDDHFVRSSAAEALGQIVTPQSGVQPGAASALIGSLEDPNREVRLYAAESLMKMGAEQAAAPTVVGVLTGSDLHLRQMAESILRRTHGDTRFLRSLLVRKLADPDPEVQLSAAEAMVCMGTEQDAFPTLAAALCCTNADLRTRASAILLKVRGDLRRLGSALQVALGAKDPERRENAFHCLQKLELTEDVRSALRRLAESGDHELRRWAKTRLVRIGG
jgi:HEAT repeat protein